MRTLTAVSRANNRSVFVYELMEMVFIVILGSALHFTFEWYGGDSAVVAFSAINESAWKHLKLVFWPALLFMLIEYVLLEKKTNSFVLAKTFGVYLAIVIIPIIFYSYTAITEKSIFLIGISTFVVAVIIGQISVTSC